jgi:ribonucleoside-diphosphate reductase alpha chain
VLSPFADEIFKARYAIDETETWEGCSARVAHFIGSLSKETTFARQLYEAIRARKLMPGGRYLYSAGRKLAQLSNCFMMQAGDSRESWADIVHRHIMILSTGGGAGTEYSEVRPFGAPINTFGGTAAGPIWLMSMVNDVARSVNHHGRKAALIAILRWSHPDIYDFIQAKNWNLFVQAMKEQDFSSPAPLDQTNLSVRLDQAFFDAEKAGDDDARRLFATAMRQALKTGEPGFTVDVGEYADEIGRNPCGEVTSGGEYLRHGDSCNLGSVNFARVRTIDELEHVTTLCTEMLILGTHLGWMPHQDFEDTRKQSRRIAVGILGLHEWCLTHGHRYAPCQELEIWLRTWSDVVQRTARKLAEQHGIPEPVRTRAVAPTGTIGIVAETTTGIEPILSVAYKTRWIHKGKWQERYNVDPTAARLISRLGYPPSHIEDAYKLSRDIRRRLEMQAFVQRFVDQGISSTVNLPAWGESGNNDPDHIASAVLEFLPRLRGLTFYPDGSRAGQPMTAIPYEEALEHGAAAAESEERCSTGSCGV